MNRLYKAGLLSGHGVNKPGIIGKHEGGVAIEVMAGNGDRSEIATTKVTPEAVLDLVGSVVAELHPERSGSRVRLDSSLERDLGLDSLGRMEVILRLERRFAISLGEQVLASAESPRDLVRAAVAAGARISEPVEIDHELVTSHAQGEPDHARSLTEVLEWHADRHGDRIHVHLIGDEEQADELTYGGLRVGAGAVACGLLERGLQAGETVAIMQPTGLDYFYTFYGIMLAGGVPVPLYPPARPSQLEDHLRRQTAILASSGARFLVTVKEAKRLLRLVAPQAPDLRAVVTVDELDAKPGLTAAVPRGPEDTAFLQYTSGSTGNPKGVILSQANLLANLRHGGAAISLDSSDIFVSWLPLYHDMGLIGACLASLYYAVPVVLMSPLAFLSRPRRWLWAIHRFRGTITAAPNFAYGLCEHRVDDHELEGLDLSSLRVAFNGAETVSPQTIAGFTRRYSAYGFHPEAMYPVYGLAESSVALAFPPLGREPRIDRVRRDELAGAGRAVVAGDDDAGALQFVSCGQPIPAHEIRIVDDAGSELGDRHEGHLQFRGPSATSGYFRNPEATCSLFHDGWLRSGDLAYIADGEVYLTGRSKDVIIRAGRNIYPHELEEAVGDLPGIRKGCVAVFGSPHPDSGVERLVVVAESRTTDAGQRQDLAQSVNDTTVDIIGTPADDVIVAAPHTVLKTSSGKIRRAACRELYEQQRLAVSRRSPWLQLVRIAAAAVRPRARRLLRAAADLLYAGYAVLVTVIFATLLWPVVTLLQWRERSWRLASWGSRLVAFLTATPIRVSGLENLPRDGSFVLVANHASYIDPFVVTAVIPHRFVWVAKLEFLDHGLTRLPLKRLGAHFVDRWDAESGVRDTRRLLEELRSGHSLAFFPEGTFYRSPGLLPFHMGAFVIAAEAGAPVVPVVLRGTRSKLRDGQWRPRRGSLAVEVLPPVHPDGHEWTDAINLRDTVRSSVLRFCGEPDSSSVGMKIAQ
jgi:1-acyl-sn-glycerol-3-phosphate acyltransferase